MFVTIFSFRPKHTQIEPYLTNYQSEWIQKISDMQGRAHVAVTEGLGSI